MITKLAEVEVARLRQRDAVERCAEPCFELCPDSVHSSIPEGRPHPPELVMGESLRFAYDTFLSNKVRFLLTALGMMIGTASLVLVVTIGMTGKQYILDQIQGIGANLIYASYCGRGASHHGGGAR